MWRVSQDQGQSLRLGLDIAGVITYNGGCENGASVCGTSPGAEDTGEARSASLIVGHIQPKGNPSALLAGNV